MAATLPASADEPDVIYLTGKVIDFLKSHPDFNITDTSGHVANNVALAAPSNRPAFTGDTDVMGFEVSGPWRTKGGEPIAPHLFYNGGVLQLATAPSWNTENITIDTWNSSEGTYGGDNVGDAPPMEFNAPMPTVQAPSDLPHHPLADGGNKYNHNAVYSGTNIIDYSFQARSVTIQTNGILEVAPNTNVVIYTTQSFTLGQNARIIVPSSSTLHLYVRSLTLGQGGEINMLEPLNPDRCWIYVMGQNVEFHQNGKICAHVIAPDGNVQLDQGDAFFGTIVARGLSMAQNSSLHWDGIPKEVCGDLLADLVGTSSGTSSGGISSAESFNEWFNDVLGVNMSNRHTIALTRNGNVYEYEDNAFFPIDDMLFGNEGDAHNFNFTYQFAANFVHDQCAEGFFEFTGADDVWVYINGELAMDLGGIMPLTRQVIEVDRLGLEHGERYTLHFYYAQRNPVMSVFRIRTNLALEGHDLISVTAKYD